MSNTRDKDPFDEIIESDVQDAVPESLIINASDAIESNRFTHMNIHRTFVTVTLSNYFILTRQGSFRREQGIGRRRNRTRKLSFTVLMEVTLSKLWG